jgi:hypothetical protein
VTFHQAPPPEPHGPPYVASMNMRKVLTIITPQPFMGFLGHEEPPQHLVVHVVPLKLTEFSRSASSMLVSRLMWSVARATQA